MKSTQGFTLIELLIAITILAFISLSIYQTTTQSFALRESLERDGEYYNTIRAALDTIGRDIVLLYSPQNEALPREMRPTPTATPAPGAPQQVALPGAFQEPPGDPLMFWSKPLSSSGIRRSRLNGGDSKLSFMATSHIRLFRDTQESELIKITYTLEDDKHIGSNKALVKTEDTDVFNDNDGAKKDTEVRYVILPNVKSLSFRFLNGEKDSWDKRWDTESVDHRGVFPSVVEVTLEVPALNSTTGETFKVTQMYRPELVIP